MDTSTNLTHKILKYALWACLYLSLLTVLLVGSNFIFPFISLKTFFFRILIEIAAFLYLLLALADSSYRPRMNKILWFLSAFGLVVFLTAIFGLDPYRSLWGTVERGEGFVFISHLILYSFILSQVFKTKNDWLNFFTASIFVSLLVGLYALFQKMGVSWALSNSAGDRFTSTLGNASYLGAYALGHFWLSLLLLWQRRQPVWKIIFALIAVFQIYILFQTQTRGAMLAFILILFLFALSLVFLSPARKIKIVFLLIMLFLVFASSLIWLNRAQPWVEQSSSFNRLANISLSHITVESRLYTLASSWQGWQDRFLFGYGWENYNLAFDKYFHAEIYRDSGSQIWFDRAHNTLLDVAIASGLVGLIAYLGIYFASAMLLIKLIYRRHLYFPLTLAAFLSAHFIQNIFVFDSLPTYIMLFGVFGCLAALANLERLEDQSHPPVLKPLNPYALSLGLILLLFAVYNLNLKPAQANSLALQGLKEIYAGNLQLGFDTYQQGIDMQTYQNQELRQKFGETILSLNIARNINDQAVVHQFYTSAIEHIQANIDEAPLNARNYLFLMALYNNAAPVFSQATYFHQTIATGQEALKLSPTRPQIYFEMGRAALSLNNKVDQGIEYFNQAVALNPANYDSHWNLMTALALAGRFDQARQEYQKMIDLGLVENTINLERLAQLYASVKNYPDLIPLYQKLIKLDPTNVAYLTQLAASYKAVGDKYNARRIAADIILKFPENKAEVEAFLSTL